MPREAWRRRAVIAVVREAVLAPAATTVTSVDLEPLVDRRQRGDVHAGVAAVVGVVRLGRRDRRADVATAAAFWLARSLKPRYDGTAIASRMPMITMTTRSSISVKPSSRSSRCRNL